MKALVATDYVPLDQITVTDHPTPAPGLGQVLIKVEAAALNPLDLALITGAVKDMYPVPLVIGMDAAPGQPARGGHSRIGADRGLPAARCPAGGGRERAGGRRHRGIGLYAVQLARALGSRVIATATAEDEEYLHGLGAAGTVDYKTADVVEETLRLVPGGVDVVVDLVNSGGGLRNTARAARPGGRLVSPLYGPDDLGGDVSPVYIGSFKAEPGDLEDLAARAADGRLRVETGARYSLEDAVQAVADFAGKHIRGKVVIEIP
ncbi:zinc-binding dehydrogenase [Streptomyces sp. NPDC000880]